MYKIFIDSKFICISNQQAYEAFCREFREVNAAGGVVIAKASEQNGLNPTGLDPAKSAGLGGAESCGREGTGACGRERSNSLRYLFICRNGLWDLPKGHQEAGEDIRDTALREVSEETGIPLARLKIRSGSKDDNSGEAYLSGPSHAPSHAHADAPADAPANSEGGLICITDHCYKRDGIWHLKHTWWYAMELMDEVSAQRDKSADILTLTPQTEEGISIATWVCRQEIPGLLSKAYSSISEVVRQAGLHKLESKPFLGIK